MSGPPAAVIVVNYGSHELLATNLTAVSEHSPEVAVVVVDNFSTEAELAAVRALANQHGWRLVASPENLGYGCGTNLGVAAAREAGAEQMLLLNPDARIDADSLQVLRDTVTADPMVLAAPVVLRPDGRVWSDGTDVDLRTGRMRATRKRTVDEARHKQMWLSGAVLMVSTQLWDRIGGIDERYFLYWEDVDLSFRVREAGGSLAVVREATAVHDEGGTHQASGSRTRSEIYYYYNIRNRLLFAAAHLDRADRRRWVRTALPEAYDIVLRGGRRQLLQSAAPWRALVKGTIDGLRAIRRAPEPSLPTSTLSETSPTATSLSAQRVRVLESFPQPQETTNPYIWMLKDCLDGLPEVSLDTFSWRRALMGRYDVFHAHWPEILVHGHSPLKMAVRQALFAAFLVRLRLNRTAIVRTLHNLELPQGIGRRETWLLQLFQRWTTLLIRINTSTEIADAAYETVVHGHYRDWFERFPRSEPVAGRLAYFGLIRRYKAVDTLINAFRSTADQAPALSLYVGGKPSTAELRAELSDLAAADDRIVTRFEFLSDAELVAAATAAELVVLPYREMHNSGGVLAALSLDRPVLVPDNEVNRQLGEEVGAAWVSCYTGDLTAAS